MKLLALVEQLFAQYGYMVLLIGLPLDAIALPIPPGNATLTYSGYLANKGILELFPAMLAAYVGSVSGMTITYYMGYKMGKPLIDKYGKWIFLKSIHLEKTKKYYEKYGNSLLLFGYFIPGLRQFLGYFVGIIHISYRKFALYSYIGSALWVSIFLGIGYIFSNQWQLIFMLLEKIVAYILIGMCCSLVIFLLIKFHTRMKDRAD